MSLVKFHKGLLENLKTLTAPVENNFYLAEDARRLYIGIKNGESTTGVALLNSGINVFDTVEVFNDLNNKSDYKPTDGDIAFIKQQTVVVKNDNGEDTKLTEDVNALVLYKDGNWIQINSPYNDNNVIKLIDEAKDKADEAQVTATDAKAKAEEAIENAATALATANQKTTLAEVQALDYATKAEAEEYAQAVRGQTEKTVADAYGLADTANIAAGDAQSAADQAQEDANSALNKFNNYTPTTEMNTAIQAVVTVGSNADTADDDTVLGAKRYADGLANELALDITDINAKLVDLTTVMNFVGKSTTDPSSGTVTISGVEITPQLGDVVVYDALEYVYTGETDKWEIFGNVTADESRFEAIEEAIGSADKKDENGDVITEGSGLIKDVDDLQTLTQTLKEKSDAYALRFVAVEDRVTVVENELNDTTKTEGESTTTVKGIKSRLTDVEDALAEEIERATDREDEIAQSVTDGFAAQAITNGLLQSNIDKIYNETNDSGYLAWGAF